MDLPTVMSGAVVEAPVGCATPPPTGACFEGDVALAEPAPPELRGVVALDVFFSGVRSESWWCSAYG